MIKETKIYRVAILGMYGYEEEKFYRLKTFAEIKFSKLIAEKRVQNDTLNDGAFCMEGFGDKNFEEWDMPGDAGSGILKRVKYGFAEETNDENGHEFYSYCQDIILEEIEFDSGAIVKLMRNTDRK